MKVEDQKPESEAQTKKNESEFSAMKQEELMKEAVLKDAHKIYS